MSGRAPEAPETPKDGPGWHHGSPDAPGARVKKPTNPYVSRVRPKPYKFIGFGDIHGPKPYKFIGFGHIHGPKPYKFIGFGDIRNPETGP